MLFITRQPGPELKGVAEENCLCQTDGFGCISVLSIQHMEDWTKSTSLFTHEIGHGVGAARHDDEYYGGDGFSSLIMWSVVSQNSHIWSTAARKQIIKTDNTCLQIVDEIRPSQVNFEQSRFRRKHYIKQEIL